MSYIVLQLARLIPTQRARSENSKKYIHFTYLGGGLNLAMKNNAKSVSRDGGLHFFALGNHVYRASERVITEKW